MVTVIVLHSWNVYIFITTLPSLISGIAHMFLPESPKFLMTTGRNEEALEVFKYVYSCNTGKPSETFPVISHYKRIRIINKIYFVD